jgi:hypothetical protein
VEPLRKVLVVFAGLREADVAWLARSGQVLHLEPGKRLITRGVRARSLCDPQGQPQGRPGVCRRRAGWDRPAGARSSAR